MEIGFFQQVHNVVSNIPYGRITSYGSIAQYLGSKGSARMVGWALNSSKNNTKNIPAHRVVNRNGLLTGKQHFGGANTMAELLQSEGLKIKDNKILDFKEKYWDPNVEIDRN
jgi:methylated-DNA-protein-cysteine methyltransferase-like protein